ncbi:MAG: tetratricopeptide repeat protein [Calditrichaeota bacterium]|nr:tetratricopeptide repeat protein [Calditrichota bacterium]
MSEMLANRYFISRKFDKAVPIFEKELEKGRETDKIKKKLIVCYIAVGLIDEAFDLFFEIVGRDPLSIINTDPYWDDCPCPEMINDWEQDEGKPVSSPRDFLILGMLYLYCDLEKSIFYLEKALELKDHFLKLNSVIRKLKQINRSSKGNFKE